MQSKNFKLIQGENMNARTKPELIRAKIETLEALKRYGHLDPEQTRDTDRDIARLNAILVKRGA